ncbi:MAG: maleylacetate reductase [Actinomycetota bacterium]|nr:maleylacetate reductase [Actinomycetota bacterium]
MNEIAEEVERLSGNRMLLIWQGSTQQIADGVRGLLGTKVVDSIGPVRPHVPADDATDARKRARSHTIDLIVTVGGGSATGLGKAVAVQGFPLLAIPTTYAGSEMTQVFGLTEAGRKQTARDRDALPRTVLYDPALTTSLPPRATATTGMNALAHAVEALYGQNRTPLTGLASAEAIRLLSRALPECVRDPSSESARSSALYGAYLAGTVVAETGMAIHHRICHVLGGTFGVAHGDANAVVLPHVVAFNERAAPEAILCVAKALGTATPAAFLYELVRSMGVPTALKELGLQNWDLDRAVRLTLDGDPYNPRPLESEAVRALLRDVYEGRPPG